MTTKTLTSNSQLPISLGLLISLIIFIVSCVAFVVNTNSHFDRNDERLSTLEQDQRYIKILLIRLGIKNGIDVTDPYQTESIKNLNSNIPFSL